MERAVFVYTTWPTSVEAEAAGRQLVERRLAACVNILPHMTSIYRWQGEVETAEEVPAILKTTATRADALVSRIAGLHSYEVPCIAVWPIDKLLLSYADWVEGSLG